MVFDEIIKIITDDYENTTDKFKRKQLKDFIKYIEDIQRTSKYQFTINGIECYSTSNTTKPDIVPQIHLVKGIVFKYIIFNPSKMNSIDIESIKQDYEVRLYQSIGLLNNDEYIKLVNRPEEEYIQLMTNTDIGLKLNMQSDIYAIEHLGYEKVINWLIDEGLNLLEQLETTPEHSKDYSRLVRIIDGLTVRTKTIKNSKYYN